MWLTPGIENWPGAFPYFYLIFFLSIIILLNINLSRRLEFFLFIISIFYLIIFSGLRDDTGGDWYRYNKSYENITYFNFKLADSGFSYLMLFSKYLGFSFNIFILFISIIFFIFFYQSYKNEKNLILILIIATPYLVHVVLLGYIRQAIACIIFIYSLQYLIKKRFKSHFLLIIISSFFHISAIVNIIFIILLQRHRLKYYLFIIPLFVYLFYNLHSEHINRILYFYVGEGKHLISYGALIRWIITAIPSIIFIIYSTKLSKNESEKKVYFLISILVILSLPFVIINSTVADRLIIYLVPIQLLVFSRLNLIFSSNILKYFVNIFVILYYNAINFTFIAFAQHSISWLPYNFWLL